MTDEIPGASIEQAEDSQVFGIILSETPDEVLEEIRRIYDQVLGGNILRYISTRSFRESLKEGFPEIGRFGSRFSVDTKLYVRKMRNENGQVVLRFHALTVGGMPHPDREREQTEALFGKKVTDYLRESGLGVPFPRGHFNMVHRPSGDSPF
ncbi:MAG: hypothetical protein AAB801_03170 [Patescibacteria group bacterium]